MSVIRNKVCLIGNLGADPEVKMIGDKKLAKVSIATNDVYKNAKGEKVTDTHWHNLVMWGKVAEISEKLLEKGREVAVEGKLVNRNYVDKDGHKRNITEIQVYELLLLGGKS